MRELAKPQLATPRQTQVGAFADHATAEQALQKLIDAGLNPNHFQLAPESLDPKPALAQTEAKEAAGAGAALGTLYGAAGGLLLAYMSLSAIEPRSSHPIEYLLGIAFLGSGIGAAATALLGGLSGANINQESTDATQSAPKYLILSTGSAEELLQAEAVLQQAIGESGE